MPPFGTIFWTAASALPLSLTLFLWARYGRVANHPTCRRCGYNLFAGPLNRTRCPECGTNLEQHPPILPGHRRPHPLLRRLALLLLFGCLAVLSWRTHRWLLSLRPGDKPNFWLLHDADHADPAIANPAINELLDRYRDNSKWNAAALSPSQFHRLADRILFIQENAQVPFSPPNRDWPRAIQSLRRQHLLTDAQWDRFLLAQWRVDLVARPRLRPGDPLPIRMRAASFHRPGIISLVRFEIEGHECPWQCDSPNLQIANPGTNAELPAVLTLPPQVLTGLSAGSHRILAHLELQCEDDATAAARTTLLKTEATFELLPRGVSSVELVSDAGPSNMAALGSAMQVNHGREGCTVDIQIEVQRPGVTICGDVTAEIEGVSYSLGATLFKCNRAGNGTLFSVDLPVDQPPPQKIEIHIIPNILPALETTDVMQIYGKPLILTVSPSGPHNRN